MNELNRILVLSGIKESDESSSSIAIDDDQASSIQQKLKNALTIGVKSNQTYFKEGGKFAQQEDFMFSFTGIMTVVCAEGGGPNPDDDGTPEHEYELPVIVSVRVDDLGSDADQYKINNMITITCSDSEEYVNVTGMVNINTTEEEISAMISSKLRELESILDEEEETYNPEYKGSNFNGGIRSHWYK